MLENGKDILETLRIKALEMDASDIFINPKINSPSFIIRFRINGEMRKVDSLSLNEVSSVFNYLETLNDYSDTHKSNFVVLHFDKNEIRVSSAKNNNIFNITIRFLNK